LGLDIVELVMRVEETFDINLTNEEAGQVQTVGDIYKIVLGKLNLPINQQWRST